jgi:P-type Cu+ transporter
MRCLISKFCLALAKYETDIRGYNKCLLTVEPPGTAIPPKQLKIRNHSMDHRPHKPVMSTSTSTTVDPICGMTVDSESALQESYRGNRYYFCSKHCVEKFSSNPEQYVGKQTAEPSHSCCHTTSALAADRPQVAAGIYICPMHPEVHQEGPGSCPKCGMALEPEDITVQSGKTEYYCPMHPEVIRNEPGSCPICGMALEPRTVTLETEANPELTDMTRRFWVCLGFTVPLVVLAMGRMLPGVELEHLASSRTLHWIELALATPVVTWGAKPFFERGWASVVNRSLNMFTLIAIGVGVAYFYSLIAVLFPEAFPPAFRGHGGQVEVYFEAAAVIVTLVLLGQVLELRARSQTGNAIRELLGLAPKTARLIPLWSRFSQATVCVFVPAKKYQWMAWF